MSPNEKERSINLEVPRMLSMVSDPRNNPVITTKTTVLLHSITFSLFNICGQNNEINNPLLISSQATRYTLSDNQYFTYRNLVSQKIVANDVYSQTISSIRRVVQRYLRMVLYKWHESLVLSDFEGD